MDLGKRSDPIRNWTSYTDILIPELEHPNGGIDMRRKKPYTYCQSRPACLGKTYAVPVLHGSSEIVEVDSMQRLVGRRHRGRELVCAFIPRPTAHLDQYKRLGACKSKDVSKDPKNKTTKRLRKYQGLQRNVLFGSRRSKASWFSNHTKNYQTHSALEPCLYIPTLHVWHII